MGKRNFAAVFEAIPKVEHLGRHPVRLAYAFLKEGEIDKDGVLQYKLYNPGSTTPVRAAVVPFALQIASLMYFHSYC